MIPNMQYYVKPCFVQKQIICHFLFIIENTIVFLVSFWYNKSVRVRVLLSNEPTSPHFNNGSIFLMRGKKYD